MEGKKFRVFVLFMIAAGFLLSAGCATAPLRSSVGLYPDQPTPVNIKGSNKQYVASRDYPFPFDDVFQASGDAAFRRGLIIEQKNEEAGTITGNGNWQMVCGGGPCSMNITFIMYVKELDAKPTTRLTFMFDRYTIMGWGGEAGVANDLLVEVQKILATY